MNEESLRLGHGLSYERRLKANVDRPQKRPAVKPRFIPVGKTSPYASGVKELRALEYVLVPEPTEVQLTNEGLNQLYVCFGAPGQGKSYLLLKLLEQLASDRFEPRWGGLLLDPKQTLISDVRSVVPADRLHVIGPVAGQGINLISSHLRPRDLGTVLALAAQSAGIASSTSDPYWVNELKRIFGAGLSLLHLINQGLPEREEKPTTLNELATMLLGSCMRDGQRRSELEAKIEAARATKLSEADSRRREQAITELSQFTSAKGDNVDTVKSFLSQSLSPFLDPDLDYLSDNSVAGSVADLVFEAGKWVLLDLPRSAVTSARLVSGILKILFQRAALDRRALFSGNERRVFLFIDEYAEVASDLPGEGFGDSIFFSQSRQFRVLTLLATQGTPMLENSGVKESWKTILSNSAGKLFFKVSDPDTAKLAPELLGEGDVIVSGASVNQSASGGSVGQDRNLQTRSILTTDLFLTGLQRGEVVFIGSTDGKSRAQARFLKVS